jgi:hypothetical protein
MPTKNCPGSPAAEPKRFSKLRRFAQRQPHYPGVAAGDRFDEHCRPPLDAVGAGFVHRLAAGDVARISSSSSSRKRTSLIEQSEFDALLEADRDGGQYAMTAPERRRRMRQRVVGVERFSDQFARQFDGRIGGQHRLQQQSAPVDDAPAEARLVARDAFDVGRRRFLGQRRFVEFRVAARASRKAMVSKPTPIWVSNSRRRGLRDARCTRRCCKENDISLPGGRGGCERR